MGGFYYFFIFFLLSTIFDIRTTISKIKEIECGRKNREGLVRRFMNKYYLFKAIPLEDGVCLFDAQFTGLAHVTASDTLQVQVDQQ